MSDEGAFAERWSAPRDDASMHDRADASMGRLPEPPQAEQHVEAQMEPQMEAWLEPRVQPAYADEAEPGTERPAAAAWRMPDPPDAIPEGRVVFSTAAPGDRLEFSRPDADLSSDDDSAASVSEPVAPVEGRLEFSSSDFLTYDVSEGAGSGVSDSGSSSGSVEERLGFPASDYLSYDVSGGGEAAASVPEPVAPIEERLDFPASGSGSGYLTYDLSEGPESEVSAAEAEAGAAADRAESTKPTAWERSLFDGSADTEPGDERYVPALPQSAPSTPPKPGTPSSGNLRLPDWMREESGYGARHQDAESSRGLEDEDEDEDAGRSRFVLIAVVVLVALVVAAGVYFLRSGDDAPTGAPPAGGGPAAEAQSGGAQSGSGVGLPAHKALRRFPGTPTAVVYQFTDKHAGVSYPRFGAPWLVPNKRNRLGQLGWSGQQVVVTERNGAQLWRGQLLSGTLSPGEMSMYGGPGTEEAAAVAYAKNVEGRFYRFAHRTRPFASQPIIVTGHKGWLVSSVLQYSRPGIRATGELVVTVLINTGRPSPAVLFMAIPNTHRELWPDINYFLTHLRVVG